MKNSDAMSVIDAGKFIDAPLTEMAYLDRAPKLLRNRPYAVFCLDMVELPPPTVNVAIF